MIIVPARDATAPPAETPIALVAIDATATEPPLITECAVALVSGDTTTGGPWLFWVQQDVPVRFLRPGARPNMALAPPWSEVAERVTAAIGGRTLVMHDHEQYHVLRRHLPDWEPTNLVLTRNLATDIWPDLDSYDINTGQGASAQLALLHLLLNELRTDEALPPDQRRGKALPRPGGPHPSLRSIWLDYQRNRAPGNPGTLRFCRGAPRGLASQLLSRRQLTK